MGTKRRRRPIQRREAAAAPLTGKARFFVPRPEESLEDRARRIAWTAGQVRVSATRDGRDADEAVAAYLAPFRGQSVWQHLAPLLGTI